MAIYDTMNLKNKGGAVPTYKSGQGLDVYSPGMGVSGRIQSDVPILQQTGEAIARQNKEILTGQIAVDEANAKAFNRVAGAGEAIAKAAINFREKYAEAKASELATQYRIKLQGLMFNNEGTGLLQTQQEGARGTSDRFQETGNGYMEELLADYGEDVKSRFYAKVNDFNMSQWEQTKRHEYTEFNKWEVNTATAEAQNFGDLAVQNSDNAGLMAEYLRLSSESFTRAYSLAGFSGEALGRKVLEHTSSNIASAIKKTIKNDVNKAEAMLKAATSGNAENGRPSFMTAKDVNDVTNAILTQRNYLETKALRAEQAAFAREQRENRKFFSEIQKPIKDTMAQLWNGGTVADDSIQTIYEGLVKHGFVEQAEEFKANVDTVFASRKVIAETSTLSIPDMENKLVALTDNFSKNLDINGNVMTSKAEIDKMRTIITGLEGALKHKKTGRDKDPAAYSRNKDNPTFTPVTDADGSLTKKEFFDASLASQAKDGVPEYDQTVLTKDELKQVKYDLEKSNEPFTYLNKELQGISPNARRVILRQLEKDNVLINNLGVLSTIDPKLANELYRYQLDKRNPDTNVKRLGMDNLEAKLIKVKGITQTILQNADNKAILETFTNLRDQAAILSTLGDLGEMLIVKHGGDFDETTAVKTAWDTICGRYNSVKLGNTNVRIPSDADSTTFKLNLQRAVNDFYKDTKSEDFKYIFRNVPEDKMPQAVADMERKTIVINDGKGGYILAWKASGMPMTVGEGRNIHYIKIDKTDEELSEDYGIKVMEGIDLPK